MFDPRLGRVLFENHKITTTKLERKMMTMIMFENMPFFMFTSVHNASKIEM